MILPFMVLVALSFFATVFTSPHLRDINLLGFYGLSYLLTKQMALVYSFLALRRCRSIRPLLTVSFIALVLMTLVGIANYIMGYSFYVEELLDNSLYFLTTSRFRVQATFNNPFDYGYICVLLALLHLYGFSKNMEDRYMFAMSQLCCLFGVLSCNCRTILLCYLVCVVVYALSMKRAWKIKLTVLGGFVAVSVILLFFVPVAQNAFLSMLSIFDSSSVSEGSSLTMRATQLATVLFYISGNLAFGRGLHFFGMDMGWDGGSGLEIDPDLYGLEGVYLSLLLEHGIVGLLLYLAVLALLIVFIFRYRRLGRKLYALGLSSIVLYILFGFMTGELYSTTPTFYILGYVVANLTLRKRYYELKFLNAKSEE